MIVRPLLNRTIIQLRVIRRLRRRTRRSRSRAERSFNSLGIPRRDAYSYGRIFINQRATFAMGIGVGRVEKRFFTPS